MSWNYRVMRHTQPNPLYGDRPGESLEEPPELEWFAIHEAYYNPGEDTTYTWSKEPCRPQGDTPQELADDLNMMLQALEQPVLEYGKEGDARAS